MSFTQVFGGEVVNPAYLSYIQYMLTAMVPQIQLTWPTQFVDSQDFVSNIVEFTASVSGCSLVMPPAPLVSVGQSVLLVNVGPNTVTIYAQDGTTVLTTLTSSQSTYMYLIDNATQNGQWRTIPWGGGFASVISVAAVSTNADLVITGSPITSAGTFTFSLAGDLLSLTSFGSGTGIVVHDSANTFALRSILGTANQVAVTNGDGVSGNPTIALASAISGINSVTASNIQIGVGGTNVISTSDGNPLIFPQSLSLFSNGASPSQLRWYDTANTNYLAFMAPATLAGNVIWTLPPTDGTAGQSLVTDGARNLSWASNGMGTVNSVSGTLDRITSTGGSNPVIDISAAYVGQTSITTLGTIGTGVWQGTPLVVEYGGTGIVSTTVYGLLAGGTLSNGPFQNAGTGVAGDLIVSTGSGSLGTWTSQLEVGVWQLIQKQTATNQPNVVFNNISGGYRKAVLIWVGVEPVNAGDNMLMRVSINNGGAYAATNYSYTNVLTSATTATATISGANATATSMLLTQNAQFTDGTITMYNLGFPFTFILYGQSITFTPVSDMTTIDIGAQWSASSVNAFEIFFSTGNVSAGDFYLYGLLPN